MKEIRPTDYEINDISFEVDGEDGNNTLKLKAMGKSGGLGITVDNFKLVTYNGNNGNQKP